MTNKRQIRKNERKQMADDTVDLIVDMAKTIELQEQTIEAQKEIIQDLQK